MKNTRTSVAIPALVVALLAGGALGGFASSVSAQTADAAPQTTTTRPGRAPHVGGTITAISGTTITITANGRHGTGSYTINASAASFMKNGAASTLSALTVGDKVMAEGTVTGTTVAATKVMSGMGPKGMGGRGHGKGPGVMGKVTAVNGSTITVTGMNGTSYTVNAGSAQVQKMVTGSLSEIVVGDTIGVHGSVSGTTVTAERIMDDMPTAPAQAK